RNRTWSPHDRPGLWARCVDKVPFHKGGCPMKAMWTMALGVAVLCALVVTVRAADEEKTLKGTITCAKCDLKIEKECTTVIKVKEDGKDVIYYVKAADDAKKKEFHKAICQEAKEGSVTGKVSKDGDKMVITASKVEFK